MHKNEPVKCYGFIIGYGCSCTHTLCNQNITSFLASWAWKKCGDVCAPKGKRPKNVEPFENFMWVTDNEVVQLRLSNDLLLKNYRNEMASCSLFKTFGGLLLSLMKLRLSLHLYFLPLPSFVSLFHTVVNLNTSRNYRLYSAMRYLSLIEAIALYGLIVYAFILDTLPNKYYILLAYMCLCAWGIGKEIHYVTQHILTVDTQTHTDTCMWPHTHRHMYVTTHTHARTHAHTHTRTQTCCNVVTFTISLMTSSKFPSL